jgi:hypothetical protein
VLEPPSNLKMDDIMKFLSENTDVAQPLPFLASVVLIICNLSYLLRNFHDLSIQSFSACHTKSTLSAHNLTVMPTLVVQPDQNPYCTPFSSKQSYKHYETGSNSTPQTTSTQKTTYPIKRASPGLVSPLEHTAEQYIASIKPSLLRKEEASGNKPVVQVPASADASLLRDVRCQPQSFFSDHATSSMFSEN